MRILVDMNLTTRWVQSLQTAGHDARHWVDVGKSSATDQQIFDYARLDRYVLLTNDLDFPRILAHRRDAEPSNVLLRGEPLTPDPERRSEALIRAC